ncbi:hypothetical protein GCK72_021031 [Caenorhabditis remanei]|uniref:C2H2-type domain-containing protein n=1 Tax=Caenorhabditis remanei TaxID=31234 RepID=A0A6A5GH10_CAERE|nr:hypothetical protein GCK72_021031 [Caenorhabditis remanei]KAF1754468.1 hypothetical protein GCK72_021031 [Caenorhabditis remanei]
MIRLSEQKVQCPKCDAKGLPSNIRTHIKAKHAAEDLKKFNEALIETKAKIKGTEKHRCDECDKVCASLAGIKKHVYEKHRAVPNPAEISLFDVGEASEPKAKIWCDEKTRDSVTSFIVDKTNRRGKMVVTYMKCHQEGNYEGKGSERVGHRTKKGTGADICPAFMQIERNDEDGEYRCVASFQHYGHETNVAVQRLHEDELSEIKKYMNEGFTNRQIIEKLNENHHRDERLRYILPDDLRNIRNKENINPGQYHREDLISLQTRVAEGNYRDGIRHFAPPINETGEQFQLGRTEQWATTDRGDAIYHTSMFAESWHSMLKKEVLGGKTNIRIDALLHHLYRAFDWIVDKNLTQALRGVVKACPRLSANRKNCRTASKEASSYIVAEQVAKFAEEGEKEYTVGLLKNGIIEREYLVVDRATQSSISARQPQSFDFSFDRTDTTDQGSSSHHPAPSPSNSVEDKAMRMYDNFVGMTSALQNHFRKALKTDPLTATHAMQSLLEEMSKHIPNSAPSLPLRPSAPSLTARQTMNQNMKLKHRSLAPPKTSDTPGSSLMNPRNISICDICLKADPLLPEDTNPVELIAQITEWKKCNGCGLAVHMECALAQKICGVCGEKYRLYSEHSDFSDFSEEEGDREGE